MMQFKVKLFLNQVRFFLYDLNNEIVEQLSEIENMVYKPHEAFEEELETLVPDEGYESDEAMVDA